MVRSAVTLQTDTGTAVNPCSRWRQTYQTFHNTAPGSGLKNRRCRDPARIDEEYPHRRKLKIQALGKPSLISQMVKARKHVMYVAYRGARYMQARTVCESLCCMTPCWEVGRHSGREALLPIRGKTWMVQPVNMSIVMHVWTLSKVYS